MNKVFEQIVSIIMRSESLGLEKLGNGALLIGRVPHVAPFARLHLLFKGLDEEKIKLMEHEIGRKIPTQFKDFLSLSNGMSIFSGSLSLYGYRNGYSREGDDSWQPFNFVSANTYEHPVDAYPHWIVIGGYQEDGSILYIDDSTGKVYRSERKYASNRLNEWPDFWTMILSEVKRIGELFDENGKIKDTNVPTHPEIQKDIKPFEE